MAASQLWYVPYRPDLVLLAPCDGEGPLPCPGSMFVSVSHLHPPERSDTKWRHPMGNAFITCFGDVATQQPNVVRCACGATPCQMRGLQEGGAVPDELIPADWASSFEPAPKDPSKYGSEGRRAMAVQLYLDCTAKADKELPPDEGQDHPTEERVKKAAEVMLTDYLKGRVCYHCNLPSTRMQKCARCRHSRYCSKECQRADWRRHKGKCDQAAAVYAAAAAAAAGGGDGAATAAVAAETKQEPAATAADDAAQQQ